MKGFLASIMFLVATATAARAEISPHDPLPTQLLTCGGSVITDIGPRLEGDKNFSSGVSVFFKNGGTQVSYDKIAAVVNSRKGDHVLICLVFVPENCPKGDARGKIYTTTNLRTLRLLDHSGRRAQLRRRLIACAANGEKSCWRYATDCIPILASIASCCKIL